MAVYAVLFVLSVLLGLRFLVRLGAPWRNPEPGMAWLQAVLAWVAVAFDVSLLLAMFRVDVPPWVYVMVLLAQDGAFAWRSQSVRPAAAESEEEIPMTQPVPTQTQHPWRATVRTVVAGLVAAIPLLPMLVDYLGVGAVPWVAGTLAVLGGVTRVLAVPAVNAWLTKYVPWLAATPRPQ